MNIYRDRSFSLSQISDANITCHLNCIVKPEHGEITVKLDKKVPEVFIANFSDHYQVEVMSYLPFYGVQYKNQEFLYQLGPMQNARFIFVEDKWFITL